MGQSSLGHREPAETFLITGAAPGLDDQHRARVRKYLTLMAIRVPALVIAGIVYNATQNGLLALAIVAISIPIPWIAVLIANDRPPRKRGEVAHYMYADHPDHLDAPALNAPTPRTIDAEGPTTPPTGTNDR